MSSMRGRWISIRIVHYGPSDGIIIYRRRLTDRGFEHMQVEAAAFGVGRAALWVCMIMGVHICN